MRRWRWWRLWRFRRRQYRVCRNLGYDRARSRIIARLDVEMLRDHISKGLAS